MRNKNSIVLLTREFNIQRNITDSPFSGLSWEDTEMLSIAILNDMLMGFSEIPETDVILFIKNSEFKKNYIQYPFENFIVIDTQAVNDNQMLNYAINYVSDNGYRRNIITMNYYPICDTTFYKNVLLFLADEQEYLFIAPLKDLTLGMVALKDIHRNIFNNITEVQANEIEKFVEYFISNDLYLITPGIIPSIMDVSDIIDLKFAIEKLIRLKLKYPQNTYNLLRQFEKKHIIKKNNETRNIRRYF